MVSAALHALMRLRAALSSDEGQTLAEYGLIMAVIAVAVIVAAGVAFQGAIVGAFDNATACISNGAGCA